jgi:hypothetical protein
MALDSLSYSVSIVGRFDPFGEADAPDAVQAIKAIMLHEPPADRGVGYGIIGCDGIKWVSKSLFLFGNVCQPTLSEARLGAAA